MVLATRNKPFLTHAVLFLALLLVGGCASAGFNIKPKQLPHHLYLGTYAASIAVEPGGLEAEEKVLDEMAKGVGYWVAFKGVEHLIEEAKGSALTWFETFMVWALPIAVNVKRFGVIVWNW
jgi:hypothetical protein